MAIILGSKAVKDTTKYQSYAYGITLPIQIGNTAFNQAFELREQVSSNIKNVLLTKKFERIMNPDFGSGLHELLFSQNDTILIEDINEVIEEAVKMWLPYVSIQTINVEADDTMKDNYEVNIHIDFRVSNDPTLLSLTLTV